MNHTTIPALPLALAALVAGCSTSPRLTSIGTGVFAPLEPPITLDGDISEWPKHSAVTADTQYLYFRVKIEGEPRTLQAMPTTLALWLDTDSNEKTGQRPTSPRIASSFGVDLEVEFSPRARDDSTANGAEVRLVASDGSRARVPHGQSGLAFLPTYAAEWYEVRIRRDIRGATGLDSAGAARGLFVLFDQHGEIEGWSDPFAVQLAEAATSPTLADQTIPPKDAGTIRVMSYNVLRDSPQEHPEGFGRIIQAINPDVVLFQEWYQGSPQDVAGWMTMQVPSDTPWRAIRGDGAGVVIVARHPIAPLGPGNIIAPGSDSPVRMVAATIYTPVGQFAIANVHLKCCGTKDSPEDLRRLAEANAINAVLRSALSEADVPGRVIGGDFNLVGSRPPLEVLSVGLDKDGSELEVVEAYGLADRSQLTWRDPASHFTPGRLDYVLAGEAGVEIVRSFVLDTEHLTDRALARIGLDRADSRVSDHLPVVVDLRAR